MQFSAFERYLATIGGRHDGVGQVQPEEQNRDYESGTVALGTETWRLRTARVTPKKSGAFVAVWRRDESGETCPFDADEPVAGVLVFVQDGERFGVFRFSAAHLERLGVTRSAAHPGKRGFRVYPSWCESLAGQAARTQREQSEAFTELSAAG